MSKLDDYNEMLDNMEKGILPSALIGETSFINQTLANKPSTVSSYVDWLVEEIDKKGINNTIYFFTLTSKKYWHTSRSASRAAVHFLNKFNNGFAFYCTENHAKGDRHIHGIMCSNVPVGQLRRYSNRVFGRNRIVPIDPGHKYATNAIYYIAKYCFKASQDDLINTYDFHFEKNPLQIQLDV
jgi:hypothetical protein